MKRATFFTFFLFIYFLSFGQKKGYGIIGFDVALPQNAPTSVHTGIGITLGYERKIQSKLTWTLQVSPTQFPIGDDPYFNFSRYQIDMVPILAGIKWYPSEAFKGFFLELDGGMSIVIPHEQKKTFNQSTFVPAFGWQIKGVEISFRENLVQDYPYFGIRLAGKF